MHKRKKNPVQHASKRQKTIENNEENCGNNANLTSPIQTRGRENAAWPDSELLKLITKMEQNVPSDDRLSFSSRLEKINWKNVALKNHSVKDCQQVWNNLVKQVRKFRLLSEILTDMKAILKSPKPQHIMKHPEKPRQPHNSYLFFVMEWRQRVTNDNPYLLPNDVARKLGQMFKNLNPQERQKYEQKAKIARQEYSEKLQIFYAEHPEMVPKRSSKKSKAVELKEGCGPPDKPKTPFELFVKVELEKEQRDDSDTPKFVFTQKCRERWNELEDQDKVFWINWAEEQYNKYVVDLKQYLKLHPMYDPGVIKPVLTKKERELKDRISGKPQKPPHGPFHLFTKMMLESEEVQKIGNKEAMRYVCEKWRECSLDEKQEFKTRVEQMWDEYEGKLEAYLTTIPPEERDEIRSSHSRKKSLSTEKNAHASSRTPITVKKPELPAMSPYKYFLSRYKGIESPPVIWKGMAEKEKEENIRKWQAAKNDYIRNYEVYLKSLSKEELANLGSSLTEYDTSSVTDSDEDDND